MNLHARDNALQLVAVLVCATVGALGFHWTGVLVDEIGSSNIALGGVAGAAVGLLVSGAALAGKR